MADSGSGMAQTLRAVDIDTQPVFRTAKPCARFIDAPTTPSHHEATPIAAIATVSTRAACHRHRVLHATYGFKQRCARARIANEGGNGQEGRKGGEAAKATKVAKGSPGFGR